MPAVYCNQLASFSFQIYQIIPCAIGRDLFDRVQEEMQRRRRQGRKYSGHSVFASRIYCGDCGALYGTKVWNSTSKYRRVIWQCNDKFKGDKCSTPHISEEEIKTRFLTIFNQMLLNRDAIIEDCKLMKKVLTDTSQIGSQLADLEQEADVVAELTKKCIAENAAALQSQEEYASKYNALVARYETVKTKIEALEEQRSAMAAKARAIDAYTKRLRDQNGDLTEFDERLWVETVDKVTIYHDARWVFRFQNGAEIEA